MTRISCDGKCCAVFPLAKGSLERIRNGANGDDGPFILDMLIPLTRRQARERAKRFGFKLPWPQTARRSDLFTCRHWDETTRRCSAYATRPQMCRDYPYNRACDHPSCGYQASNRTQAKWRRIRARIASTA